MTRAVAVAGLAAVLSGAGVAGAAVPAPETTEVFVGTGHGVVPEPHVPPLRYSAVQAPSAGSRDSRVPVQMTLWVWFTELM